MLVSEFLLWDTAHTSFCKEHLRRSAFLSFSFALQGNGKKRIMICQVHREALSVKNGQRRQ